MVRLDDNVVSAKVQIDALETLDDTCLLTDHDIMNNAIGKEPKNTKSQYQCWYFDIGCMIFMIHHTRVVTEVSCLMY
jgi:hypothetical protein